MQKIFFTLLIFTCLQLSLKGQDTLKAKYSYAFMNFSGYAIHKLMVRYDNDKVEDIGDKLKLKFIRSGVMINSSSILKGIRYMQDSGYEFIGGAIYKKDAQYYFKKLNTNTKGK